MGSDLTPSHLCRVVDPVDGRPVWARRDDQGQLITAPGTIEELHQRRRAGAALPSGRSLAGDSPLLAPVAPSKIVCVGLNYAHHAAEMNKAVPDQPLLFLKPPTALIGPGAAIELPPESKEVHHEGELAVVIGQRLRDADEAQAQNAIFGYSCACDVTARDIQRRESRYTRAKGFDTFAPVGPTIALADQFHPADHHLKCYVDGQLRQSSPLDDFIFSIPTVVAFISQVMTLLPGDLILTGTPAGVAPIKAGQTVTVSIDGIGTLENPVQNRRRNR